MMIISKNWGLGKTTLCVLPLLLKKFFNLLLELLRLSLLSYSVVPTLLGLENGEADGVGEAVVSLGSENNIISSHSTALREPHGLDQPTR